VRSVDQIDFRDQAAIRDSALAERNRLLLEVLQTIDRIDRRDNGVQSG
jgi:hypothetical protein